MFDKALMIIITALATLTLIFAGMAWYYHNDRDHQRGLVQEAKTKSEIVDQKHKVDMIEKDFEHINKIERERQNEDVRYDVGFHTTIFN